MTKQKLNFVITVKYNYQQNNTKVHKPIKTPKPYIITIV